VIHTRDVLPYAVLKIRLSGTEVHLVPITHHSERLDIRKYKVTLSGEYNTEAMMLYTHFNESHIQDSVFVIYRSKTFISSSLFVVASDNLNPLSEIPCNGIGQYGQYRLIVGNTYEGPGRGHMICGPPVTP
jgi:hypothetical protein